MKYKIILALTILFIIASLVIVKKINDWFESHYFTFNQPVKVSLLPPMEIKKREPQIIVKNDTTMPIDIDTPIKKYICKVFGQFECKTAIAVALHEGLNHPMDSFNLNTNNTIDVGYFRINSVHFKQDGCSLAEVITEKGNVDCAYKIWQASGWQAWVAYKNGNYLSSL